MAIAAAALVALAVFVTSHSILSRRGVTMAARLARIAGLHEAEALAGVGGRVLRPMLRPIAMGLVSVSSTSLAARIRARIEARLITAGQPLAPRTFMAILVGAPPALGGIFTALLWGSGTEGLALVIASFGVVGPLVWLSGRVTRRRSQINRELPDTLDLIIVSLEAGLGFEAAIARITDRSEGTLAEELRSVLAEMNVGRGRRHALQALAARTGVPSVGSLVSAILQAEQTGMSIAQVLRAQSDHLRILRRQRAEELAMKAPLKMLFPLVFFIFPSLFVVILGPAILQLLKAMRESQ